MVSDLIPRKATQWVRLPEGHWEGLYSHGRLQRFARNTIIYQQDALPIAFYIVRIGRVRITINDDRGNEKVMVICERESMFGESCALAEEQGMEMATAIVPTEAYAFDASILQGVVLSNPSLAHKLTMYMYDKICVLYSQLEDQCFRSASMRVVSQLIKLSYTHGKEKNGACLLEMRFTVQKMADMASISRVSASRIMKKLMTDGLLAKVDGYYVLPDIARLYKLL